MWDSKVMNSKKVLCKCVCVCVLPLAQTDSVPLSVRVAVWRGRTSGSVLAVYTPAEEKHCYNQIYTIYIHIYTKPDIWSNNHQRIRDSHEYSSTQKWQQWSIRKMTTTWLLKTHVFSFFSDWLWQHLGWWLEVWLGSVGAACRPDRVLTCYVKSTSPSAYTFWLVRSRSHVHSHPFCADASCNITCMLHILYIMF